MLCGTALSFLLEKAAMFTTDLELEAMAVAHLFHLKKESQRLKQEAHRLDHLIEELQDSLNGKYTDYAV